MTKSMKTTAALLAGAFLLVATLPTSAQQSPASGNGPQAASGRTLGPGDGTGNQGVGPRDGTGFGSLYLGTPTAKGMRGAGSGSQLGSGTCTGTGPQGSQGSSSRGSSGRRGRG